MDWLKIIEIYIYTTLIYLLIIIRIKNIKKIVIV
jgi:hypothetical protein